MSFLLRSSRKILSIFFLLSLWSSSIWAANRYVATTGTDAANDCSNIGSPCLTLQWAINQSTAGDTINVADGTYSVTGLVTVTKSLTFKGNQAGVDARTRTMLPESILSNTQGISVAADNVTFDGFTIQDSSVSVFTGYGIWINPGKNGTQIINNIFQNNIAGLGLSNGGASQCLVQHNLFKDNNLAGGAFGTGIYTDQYVSGAVSNVLINENTFENNDNAGIGFASDDITRPDSNITISNNTINNCGRGMYLLNTQSSMIANNTITNLTAPTDGGNSVALGIYGGVSDLMVKDNNFETGIKYGIRIATLIPGSPAPANSAIEIHMNNIFGFAVAGMQVDAAPSSLSTFATCNWWGSDTGPTNETLNPSGTGDVVAGDLISANFNPWLLGPAPDGSCGMPPTVSKSFSPSTIYRGDSSTVTITLTNPNTSPAVLMDPFVDTLPRALKIIGKPKTTCDGTVSADKNTSTVTLADGTIPANGSCTITVKITSCIKGTFTNIIPVGALQTDMGSNQTLASAVLNVLCNFATQEAIDACYPY